MPSNTIQKDSAHDHVRTILQFGAIALVLSLFVSLGFAPKAIAGARPLSDFLNAQGTTNIFVPPVPDYIAWCGEDTRPPIRFASVDYAGLAAKWLTMNGGPSLGTVVTGDVNERTLSDGRAQVTVNLSTSNALTWAVDCAGDISSDPLLFGYRAQDLLANSALQPGLSSLSMQVVFTNTAPGAPLPDLVNAFILGNALPTQQLLTLSFHSDGFGPLRSAFGVADGTRGEVVVTQTGNFKTSGHGTGVQDGFPAEVVSVKIPK
jgi:hypothetical protein